MCAPYREHSWGSFVNSPFVKGPPRLLSIEQEVLVLVNKRKHGMKKLIVYPYLLQLTRHIYLRQLKLWKLLQISQLNSVGCVVTLQ